MQLTSQQMWIISLALAALAVVLIAGVMIWRARRADLADERVDQLRQASLSNPAGFPFAQAMPGISPQDRSDAQAALDRLRPPAWMESGTAKALLADEDRKLLNQAGIDLVRGGLTYVSSRVVLAIGLPALLILLVQPKGTMALVYGFLVFGLGMMLPKWILRSKATRRRQQVEEELPLFVDLLRLLQGVGLSIDQSLQILATEFSGVLRVISGELVLANQLYSSGRSREQSLQRLSTLGADEDMYTIVSLLVQVDRHGGAVQEPLKEFGVRLREKRQANFKEKIGTITVKMTGVMVLTLLPALMVITAGPGFTAIFRSLASMKGG